MGDPQAGIQTRGLLDHLAYMPLGLFTSVCSSRILGVEGRVCLFPATPPLPHSPPHSLVFYVPVWPPPLCLSLGSLLLQVGQGAHRLLGEAEWEDCRQHRASARYA